MTKPKSYRITRMKQSQGKRYRLHFSWDEGDPHIQISMNHRTIPFDTINVCDHANDYKPRITSREDFCRNVSEWLKDVAPDTLRSAWEFSPAQ